MTYTECSQVHWLTCIGGLQFLRAVGLAVPHWYSNSASKADELQHGEQRFTDDLAW